jgi:hypothetical protein
MNISEAETVYIGSRLRMGLSNFIVNSDALPTADDNELCVPPSYNFSRLMM